MPRAVPTRLQADRFDSWFESFEEEKNLCPSEHRATIPRPKTCRLASIAYAIAAPCIAHTSTRVLYEESFNNTGSWTLCKVGVKKQEQFSFCLIRHKAKEAYGG
jgi:hypothetical protein